LQTRAECRVAVKPAAAATFQVSCVVCCSINLQIIV